MNKFIQDFITKNLWSIIMITAASIIFYANTNTRLDQIEVKAMEAREEAASLRVLIERVIVLEEHDRSMVDDIGEIKAEIKEVKSLILKQGF